MTTLRFGDNKDAQKAFLMQQAMRKTVIIGQERFNRRVRSPFDMKNWLDSVNPRQSLAVNMFTKPVPEESLQDFLSKNQPVVGHTARVDGLNVSQSSEPGVEFRKMAQQERLAQSVDFAPGGIFDSTNALTSLNEVKKSLAGSTTKSPETVRFINPGNPIMYQLQPSASPERKNQGKAMLNRHKNFIAPDGTENSRIGLPQLNKRELQDAKRDIFNMFKPIT